MHFRSVLGLALFTALSSSACVSKKDHTAKALGSHKEMNQSPAAVSGQLLVAFTNPEFAQSRSKIWKKHGLREIEKVGSTELYLVEVPSDKNFNETKAKVASEKGVKYAEANLIMSINGPKNP